MELSLSKEKKYSGTVNDTPLESSQDKAEAFAKSFSDINR